MSDFTLRKHSVKIAGHATSITLEDIFWQQLDRMAEEQSTTISQLLAEIDTTRLLDPTPTNLSSAIRVTVLQYLLATDVYFETERE